MFNMKSLLFLLLSFQHLYSIQLQKEFLKTEGFTLKLPSDWIEIPNQILNEHIEQGRIFFQQEKSVKFNYAFQLSSSEYWFQPPYILIDVDNSLGRIPESEFNKIQNLNNKFEKGIDDFLELSDTVMHDINLELSLYDPENHILWLKINSELEKNFKIIIISGFILTQNGMIKVVCYTLDEEYNIYAHTFKDIILNLQIDEALRYKTSFFDSYTFLNKIDWPKVIAYVILAVLFALFYPYFKRKKDKF